MTSHLLARRMTVTLLLTWILSVLPGLATSSAAFENGIPSRLRVFLPGSAISVPGTAYVDHPFDIHVWIADDGLQLVKAGTSATVTISVDPGPEPLPTLTCPGGMSTMSMSTGPNAGLASFLGCTVDKSGDITLTGTASNVVSTIVPTPTIASDVGVRLHVLPSFDAPQESISLTLDGTPDRFVVLTYGQSIVFRIVFTEHGANQPFRLQESPRTTSRWTTVAEGETDDKGVATLSVRPEQSAWYRVVYAGSPDLAAGRSPIFTAALQASAKQRPVHAAARIINRGTTVRFTTTIRPIIDELAPMKVGFQLYHRVAGRWRLASLRTRAVDTAGVARINITFGSPGDWYVRSYAKGQRAWSDFVDPAGFLLAIGPSEPTKIARFRVR